MSGETALARQLKKLAVPQTTVLIQDKIRKSILYDHRDAAGLDRDLIFFYGTNGLERLRIINPLFSRFESNLFSLNYKDFERSVQSKEVNKKLDLKICEFLRMLSPYILIRAAHEALEWLIYRFHIHMYNVDDLIASVLPHHNTSTFVRVVQLLDLDERSRWYWLKSVQKTNMHLDYSALLNRFISDGGFRKFVCDIAPNILKVYKDHEGIAVPIISFSMLTIYNALCKCHSIEDKLITFLFPYIFNGLSSGLSNYGALSYMVICRIVTKVKLTPEITEQLLIRVFQKVQEDLIRQAFELLLLVFHYQSIKSLPSKVHAVMLSHSESVNILSDLTGNFESFPLIRVIIKKTLLTLFKVSTYSNAKKSKSVFKFLKLFLHNVKLNEKSSSLCFNVTLKNFSKCCKDKKLKNTSKQFKRIAKYVFKFIENKYPDHFDKAYKGLLSKPEAKLDKRILCKVINNSVCSMKYKMLPNMKTSLVLGLNHANTQIRQTSVSYLLELVAKNEFSEREFVENALYDRLLDKSPNVVQTVLSSPDLIVEVLGKSKMIVAFEDILKRKVRLESVWYSIQMKCLDIIARKFKKDENSYDILPLILQFIFPLNINTIEGFLFLLNSDVENPFLQELKIHEKDINKNKDANNENILRISSIIIASVESFVEKMDEISRSNFAVFLKSKTSVCTYSFFTFYVYVMQYMITRKNENKYFVAKCIEDLLLVLEFYICQPNITFNKYEVVSEQCNIEKSLESLNKNKFPVSLVYDAFHNIITRIEISLEHDPWPTVKCSSNYRILTLLFDFCILHSNSDKDMLKEYFTSMISLFISHQFQSVQKTFCFLSTKWANYAEDIPLTVQVASINIAIAFPKQQNSMNWVFDDNVFLCLLKAIANPDSSINGIALNLLSSVLDYSKDYEHHFKLLTEEILSQSEEIKIDYRQIYECIGYWLKPAIELIDARKITQALHEKGMQSKKFALEKFLNLLTQDVPITITHFLLLCLQNADSQTILAAYIPVLHNSVLQLQKIAENKIKLLTIIELLLKKFTPKTAMCLFENSNESKALLYCLNFSAKDEKDIENSVQALTLSILNKEFFAAIPSIAVQQKIFDTLLNLYMMSPTNINIKIEKVLRKLSTYAYIFLKHFQDNELAVSRSTTLREAKLSKSKDSQNNSSTFENGPWKKLIVFLELMQNKSKLLKKDVLIPELFNLLNKSLDFESQAPVEYLRQLILSTIHSCCEQLGSAMLDERQFQVELIVQCIRSSTNAKTHHQSLLLLNLAAAMFPDYVLSNVMSIFTFMGSSLVRQDDSYSFQVISQTIETIVPSLLEASNQQTEKDGIQVVASVIRVFVDSLSDIPGHRQLPLFTKLISTLDPSKYLWIPLGQICDQYATIFHDITADDSKNWKISPTLEFAVNLHKQFSPDIQIDTCIKLIRFLTLLPDTKKQLDSNPEIYQKIIEPFNVNIHTNDELQIYKHNVLSYMKIWLSSQAFLNQVSELNIKEQYSLEEKYELLLESVLSFLQDRLSSKLTEKGTRTVNSQVQLLYDLVYAINSLLPCNLFIRVIRRLLKHDEKEIQMKSIELLNTKLEQQQGLIQENHKALLKLLKPLLKLVDKCINEESKAEKQAIIEQTALYSLHLLSKLIGSEYPTKFYKVLHISVTILNKYTQPELIVNALLCLAQLCNCLNVDVLPHLNSFMPVIVNILKDKNVLHMSECLISGIIAALQSIVEHLGMFLSSYMEAIITGICTFSEKYSELGKKVISEKFVNLQNKIANEIALRVLLTAIESSYAKLSPEIASNAIPLMKILTEKLNSSTYEDILACSPQLQKFYISLLDFRNCNQDLPSETIAQIESSIISSLETFVMKLSVTRFRTFFQKIYQWSTTTVEEKEQKYRIFTFYKMTSKFSKSLKSLFSHMAKYFFRHAATVIDSNNVSKSKVQSFDGDFSFSQELLVNVLDTLNCCFMYSEGQLLDKENFDLLLQPLVDQIENFCDETFYQELIENHLSNCIAYFMAAVSDSALWKALNYQILLKTRHDSPKVRFGSLQVIQEVVNKMGDNYLVLLPESIPFLAEIMEDESAEVEQECQTVIIEMEKILGEPIRKYF